MRIGTRSLQSKIDQTLLMLLLTIITLSSVTVDVNALQDVESVETLLDPVNITVMINTNGSTTILFNARVKNIGPTSILEISIRIDSLELTVLSAMSGGVLTEFSTLQMERHTMVMVNLQQELEINESSWIDLVLLANDLQTGIAVESSGNFLHGGLVFYVRPHVQLSNLTFIAKLPSHASLSHDSAVPLFPNADANFTDGESMAFIWYIPLLQPGQESAFIIRYQEPVVSIINSEDSVVVLSFIGILGVFIGIGITKVGPILHSYLRRTKVVQYHGITNEEELIISRIKSKGGSCSQKELYRELDIGESKLSLILTGLEERGLINRLREGRQNIVHIIEKSE